MKRHTILIPVIALLLGGCFKSDLTVNIPEGRVNMVVEGYITPGYPAEIMLTESNTLQDDLVLLAVWNAQVKMGTDTGTLVARNILYKKTDRRIMVNYGCPDTVRAGGHSFFHLNIVTKDGRTVQASTKVVSQVHIQRVELNDDHIVVHHDGASDASRYYRLLVASYKQGKPAITKSLLYDQPAARQGTCVMPLSNYKAGADSLVLSLFRIQKEYYDYLHSVENANSAFSDPLLNPETIQSNITGGIGIFTYYTFDKTSVKLR